jgi:hypothetical protein
VKGRWLSATRALAVVILLITRVPGFAQEDMMGSPTYYVARTGSADDILTLRTEPSSRVGLYIMSIPDETLLDVVERRSDRWWFVRVLPFGQEGWVRSGDGSRRWVACCVIANESGSALEESVRFRTSSNDVYCMLQDSWLRCDINQIVGPMPARPRGCSHEWGDAFIIEQGDRPGYRVCHDDTVAGDALPPLSYGDFWREGDYTCTSERNGLTCVNSKGHGFTLSRTSQRVF